MKIELHTHSEEISNCGHLSVEDLIDLYKNAGYDAMVLCNHFNTMTANILMKKHGINDLHKAYFDCIEHAAEVGKEKGLLVLGGCELRFDHNENDYLVYGMTAEMCKDWRKICAMKEEEFSEFAKANGILFYQAHPFRNKMTVVNPEYLFGIEIQNTHPRHDSRNDIAAMWAEKYNLHKIAGSDCHQIQDAGTSAIYTDYEVRNMDDLVHVLRNDLYEIR